MTREEAVKILKGAIKKPNTKDGYLGQALDMAIKALEQKPCGDCISRKQAINELKLAYFNKDLQSAKDDPCIVDAMTDWSIRTIKKLPSVTPTRPKGKWIHWTDDYKDYVTCSCCRYGEEGEMLLSDKTPFCPICGADMSEVNADEDSD